MSFMLEPVLYRQGVSRPIIDPALGPKFSTGDHPGGLVQSGEGDGCSRHYFSDLKRQKGAETSPSNTNLAPFSGWGGTPAYNFVCYTLSFRGHLYVTT